MSSSVTIADLAVVLGRSTKQGSVGQEELAVVLGRSTKQGSVGQTELAIVTRFIEVPPWLEEYIVEVRMASVDDGYKVRLPSADARFKIKVGEA